MSLLRLIYYSAIVGGWAAFVGWLLCELLVLRRSDLGGSVEVALVGGVVGAAIGGGLNLVAGMANARWKQLVARLVPGLVCGFAGGAVGGFVGDRLFSLGLPRALGWMLMGLCIGVVEGVYDRSASKIRNGLIGGGIGGLVGGFLFDLAAGSGMSGRATAFVILGLSIGALIGLVQVVLKEAWLTVIDGYRSGRQLILSAPVTFLGKAEHVALPFLGQWGHNLEPEHTRILRQPDGSFAIEDNHTTIGTRVNRQVIPGRQPLQDGDVIQLGINYVRFSEKQRKGAALAPLTAQRPAVAVTVAPAKPVAAMAHPAASQDPPRAAPVQRPVHRPVPGPRDDVPIAKPAPRDHIPIARPAPTKDACPKCGRKAPGAPGGRYCMVCDVTF